MGPKKKSVFNDPCQEAWEDMEKVGCNRNCATCNTIIHDLTQVDLKTITENYLESDTCVRMHQSQVDYFKYMRQIHKVACLSTALTFAPILTAQEPAQEVEITTVVGHFKGENRSNIAVYVVIDGVTFQTQTNSKGKFELVIPRNTFIERTNISQLTNKLVRRKKIRILFVRQAYQHFIGVPDF